MTSFFHGPGGSDALAQAIAQGSGQEPPDMVARAAQLLDIAAAADRRPPVMETFAQSRSTQLAKALLEAAEPLRTPYLMEPTLLEEQRGMDLPDDVEAQIGDGGTRLVYRGSNEPVPIVRRPNVLPVAATPDGSWTFAMPRFFDIFSNVIGGPGMAANSARGAQAAGKLDKIMASRSAKIYDPPAKPPRPFEADYPRGALADEHGRLTHTIDGDPLVAKYVAGRRVAGGADEGLSPAEFDAVTEGLLGKSPAPVPARGIGGDAGRFSRTQTLEDSTNLKPGEKAQRGADEFLIRYDQSLSAGARNRVVGHEVGHAVDYFAGQRYFDRGLNQTWRTVSRDRKGFAKETERVYNQLNNPDLAGRDLDGLSEAYQKSTKYRSYTPAAKGYRGADEINAEYLAEAIRAYMADPNYLKTVAPKTAAAIRAAVNANPRLSRVIQFNARGGPGLPGLMTENDP